MGILDSKSTSSTDLDQIDARVVGAQGGYTSSTPLNISARRSVSVNMLDAGAVGQSLQLAMRGVDAAAKLASDAQAAQGGLLAGALSMASDQNRQFATALENVKTTDQRALMFAALAAVALVAVRAFKG